MTEELNPNTTPAAIDTPAAPVNTPIETPPAPPTSEPIAPTEPAPVSPAPAAPVPPPTPEPEATALEPAKPAVPPAPVPETSAIHRLLAKAREKIQFRKAKKLEKVMVFARERGSIQNDDVQKLLRVSDATATRYLVALVKSGQLRRVGHPRNASYEPLN